MKLRYYQVDAFSAKPFGGNPAGVCPLDEWLDDDLMQAIAEENNLPETAFFVRDGNRYDIRWFAPQAEVQLCGHATLASAFVLTELLRDEAPEIRFRSRAGVDLSVRRDGARLALNFPSHPPTKADLPVSAHDMFGVEGEAFTAPHSLVVVESESQLRAIVPDADAVRKLDSEGVIVTAPGDEVDFVSRFFAPKIGIPEDHATGSAHCTLIPYWHDRLGKTEFHARQLSPRGAELFCESLGDRVKIAGKAALYLEGHVFV